MALVAERFVIIGRGRLLADVSAAELDALASERSVRVRTPDASLLRDVLSADGVEVRGVEPGVLTITGLSSDEIGTPAAAAGVTLFELTPQKASLEQTFMELTHDAVEYHGGNASPTTITPTVLNLLLPASLRMTAKRDGRAAL